MAKRELTRQQADTYVGNIDAVIGWLMATATPSNEAQSQHLRNQLSEIAYHLRPPEERGE